jgi:hypothetical protein
VQVVDLKVAPVKVGYVMGGGDEVPERDSSDGRRLSRLLDADMLATGELSQFDHNSWSGYARQETRPDFVAHTTPDWLQIRRARRHAHRPVSAG